MENEFNFLADYHTHTTYSHGTGSIEDNVKHAEEIGLKEIAITDHGLGHIVFGLKRRKLDEMRKEIDRLNSIYKVKTYLGIESDIISAKGAIDLKESDYEKFDIILCGFHKCVWPKTPAAMFGYCYGNVLRDMMKLKPSKRVIERNTKAYIKAIEQNKIDILTHIGFGIPCNFEEVAKAARDYGTKIELNSKRITYSDEDLIKMVNTGVEFVVDSDAHSPDRVGEFSLVLEYIKRLNLPKEKIMNWDKLPNFKKIRNK